MFRSRYHRYADSVGGRNQQMRPMLVIGAGEALIHSCANPYFYRLRCEPATDLKQWWWTVVSSPVLERLIYPVDPMMPYRAIEDHYTRAKKKSRDPSGETGFRLYPHEAPWSVPALSRVDADPAYEPRWIEEAKRALRDRLDAIEGLAECVLAYLCACPICRSVIPSPQLYVTMRLTFEYTQGKAKSVGSWD
jgi:hypothetical protein